MAETLSKIVEAVKRTLERTPPELKVTDLGRPDKRCKPITSTVVISNSSSGNAEPI